MSTVIKVENLSKRYRIGLKESRKDTFLGQIGQTLRAPIDNFRQLRSLSRFREDDESVFWALRDINFEVKEGEVLGIIGHNGAGKSTLLKILSRITEPTSGSVKLRGRVSALLEVGTGFHPELTGRENIYMNGTILGMTRREIDRKLDEIVDFSGVEKHIDTPVKFYSSGMKVRLGFAVAANLEPEILVIDEVLAVGDIEFQRKCLGKMEDVSRSGRTVLFVSHDMGAIKTLCPKALLLKNGKINTIGTTGECINNYVSETSINALFQASDVQDIPIRVEQLRILDENQNEKTNFLFGEDIVLEITTFVLSPITGAHVNVGFRHNGTILFRSMDTDEYHQKRHKRETGRHIQLLKLSTHVLKAGIYSISIDTGIRGSKPFQKFNDVVAFEIYDSDTNLNKSWSPQREGFIKCPGRWIMML